MLMLGEGVDADPVAAYEWLTIAAAQDLEAAERLLGKLRGSLKEAEIKRAEAQAAAFAP